MDVRLLGALKASLLKDSKSPIVTVQAEQVLHSLQSSTSIPASFPSKSDDNKLINQLVREIFVSPVKKINQYWIDNQNALSRIVNAMPVDQVWQLLFSFLNKDINNINDHYKQFVASFFACIKDVEVLRGLIDRFNSFNLKNNNIIKFVKLSLNYHLLSLCSEKEDQLNWSQLIVELHYKINTCKISVVAGFFNYHQQELKNNISLINASVIWDILIDFFALHSILSQHNKSFFIDFLKCISDAAVFYEIKTRFCQRDFDMNKIRFQFYKAELDKYSEQFSLSQPPSELVPSEGMDWQFCQDGSVLSGSNLGSNFYDFFQSCGYDLSLPDFPCISDQELLNNFSQLISSGDNEHLLPSFVCGNFRLFSLLMSENANVSLLSKMYYLNTHEQDILTDEIKNEFSQVLALKDIERSYQLWCENSLLRDFCLGYIVDVHDGVVMASFEWILFYFRSALHAEINVIANAIWVNNVLLQAYYSGLAVNFAGYLGHDVQSITPEVLLADRSYVEQTQNEHMISIVSTCYATMFNNPSPESDLNEELWTQLCIYGSPPN